MSNLTDAKAIASLVEELAGYRPPLDGWEVHFARDIAAMEREACAKVCEEIREADRDHSEEGCWECGVEDGALYCFEAIRARGETTGGFGTPDDGMRPLQRSET